MRLGIYIKLIAASVPFLGSGLIVILLIVIRLCSLVIIVGILLHGTRPPVSDLELLHHIGQLLDRPVVYVCPIRYTKCD